MSPHLCSYCGGIVRADRCASCGAPSRRLPGIQFSDVDFSSLSAQCPIKVVFNPDLPYTTDKEHFPVARATSILTRAGLRYLHRKAIGRCCLSKWGRRDIMKMHQMILVMSQDTMLQLQNQLQEHEHHQWAEGVVAGYQMVLCDKMARHDFVAGQWISRSFDMSDDSMYEIAEFEDSLILSPDGKTPLVAIRHARCVLMELLTCTES